MNFLLPQEIAADRADTNLRRGHIHRHLLFLTLLIQWRNPSSFLLHLSLFPGAKLELIRPTEVSREAHTRLIRWVWETADTVPTDLSWHT